VVLTVPMLDKLKIDDVVGAIPVHLFAGIWGTLAVVLTNGDASLGGQIISIIIVGAFVVVVSCRLVHPQGHHGHPGPRRQLRALFLSSHAHNPNQTRTTVLNLKRGLTTGGARWGNMYCVPSSAERWGSVL
jgi:hypothetical protein